MDPSALASTLEAVPAELDADCERKVPRVFWTHPDRRRLLGNHPPERFGCAPCHHGQGRQTRGVGSRAFDHGWDDPGWPSPLLDKVQIEDGTRGVFVQSTCRKCHGDDTRALTCPAPTAGLAGTDVHGRDGAEVANRGRRLVLDLGCHGCHHIEGLEALPFPGRKLTSLREQTTFAWLEEWLRYPNAWRPRTRMPQLWPDVPPARRDDKLLVREDRDAHGAVRPGFR